MIEYSKDMNNGDKFTANLYALNIDALRHHNQGNFKSLVTDLLGIENAIADISTMEFNNEESKAKTYIA